MDPVTLKPIETPPGIPADFAAALAAASAGWYASKEVVRPSTILDEKRSATVRTVATGICRYFDGANDYIHCGDVPQVGGAGALSVFAWIKTTGSTGRRAICSQWGLSVDQRAFALWIESDQLRGIVSSNGLGTGNTKDILSASGIANNTWRHVGMVFDGGGSTLTLYVDGASANLTVSDNAAVATVFDSSDPMMIGAYDIGALSGYFVDRMFDVRVYTRALSGSEVTALYNSTRIAGGDPIGSVSTANLVRHYRLDEQATGNVDIPPAYCTAGSGVHGRMYNASFSNIVTDVTVPISYDNEVGYSQWSTAAELAANGTLVTAAGVSDFTHANWTKVAGATASAADTLAFSVGAGSSAYALFSQAGVSHPVLVGQCVTWEFEVRAVNTTAKFRAWVQGNSGAYPSLRTSVNYTTQYQAVDSDWLRVVVSSEAIGVGNVSDNLTPIIYFYSSDNGGGATSASFQFRNVKMYRDIAVTRQPRLTTTPANDVRNRPVEYTGEAQRIALATDSGCVTLDGVNDRLDLSSSLSLTPPYTISCWVYRAASADSMLVVDGASGNGLRILSDKPSAYFGASNYRYFGTAITNSVWTHLAISVPTGNASDVSCYMDGVKNQAASVHTGSADLTLSSIGSTAPINGRMADVRVFTSALSQSEIQDVMNDRTTAPVALEHWPLAEMAGNTSYSVGSGGRTLTHVNTTESTLWANRQPKVHYNLTRGFRNPTASGSYRTFDGVRQYCTFAGNANLRMGTDKFWVAMWIRAATSAATRSLIGTWGSDREWLLQMNSSDQLIWNLSASGAANQGGMTLTSQPVTEGNWCLAFVGQNTGGTPAISMAIDGNTFVTNTYGQTSVRVGVGTFSIGAEATGSNFFPGDIAWAAVGRSSSALDFTVIRDALWNSGTPLSYSQLSASQKTDWGLVSWWDGTRLDRSFIDVHGANTLAPVGIPYVPARLSADLAGDGGAITHRPGAYHNDAETKIDFTGGVSTAPWLEGLSIPSTYTNNSTLPGAMTRRRAQNAGGVVVEDRFTATG